MWYFERTWHALYLFPCPSAFQILWSKMRGRKNTGSATVSSEIRGFWSLRIFWSWHMATDRGSVQSPHLLRHAWSGWNSLWGPDSLATGGYSHLLFSLAVPWRPWLRNIVIMLALCYEFFNSVTWILPVRGQLPRLARLERSCHWSFMRYQHWPQVLLSLFCAIWTPLIVSFHPLVTKECLLGVENIPNDYQIVCQVFVFIIANILCAFCSYDSIRFIQ